MTDWPLHVTLADVFRVQMNNELCEKLSDLLRNEHPITITGGKESILGETRVTLLDNSVSLMSLHCKITDLLESYEASFNNPEFTRDGFLPHCTIQETVKLGSGDTVNINTVSLIDMFPRDNWMQRQVLESFRLLAK